MFSSSRVFATGALVVVMCGCSSPSMDRYIPAPDTAREALAAALEAWKRGEEPGAVTTYRVPIQVADSHRKPNEKLESFEILGEVSEDGGRIFQVRLHFSEPKKVEKAQFVIVGIEPLWVFRREDYDMIAHWEHPTTTADTENNPDSGKAEAVAKPDSAGSDPPTPPSPKAGSAATGEPPAGATVK